MTDRMKALMAFLFAAVVAVRPFVLGDHVPNADEWVQIFVAVTGTASVHLVPLAQGMAWAKTAVGLLFGVLQVLTTVTLTGADPFALVAAIAGAIAVAFAPARSVNGVRARAGIGDGPGR